MSSHPPTFHRHPFFRTLRGLPRPVVVAHRGWSACFPENTIAAFEAAVAVGAEMLEFDVHETKDHRYVCIHDGTLDRTTDAQARLDRDEVEVKSMTAAEIAGLDAGSWRDPRFDAERVPLLSSILDSLAHRVLLMLEHKGGSAETLIESLVDHPARDRVLVQSFDHDFIARCHTQAPWLALGALGEGELDDARLAAIRTLGVGLVHWDVADLRLSAVEAIHAAELASCVYTANSDAQLLGSIAMGLTAVTTNHPDRLLALRSHR